MNEVGELWPDINFGYDVYNNFRYLCLHIIYITNMKLNIL